MTAIPKITRHAFVSIQYPGMQHGRFNQFSEGVAHKIVTLWHEMGGTGAGHWQPEGYSQLSKLPLRDKYTPSADQYMVPTSLGVDVSPNFVRAVDAADALGMANLYYDGTACVHNAGTPKYPDVRYINMPDDGPIVTERVMRIIDHHAIDYLFIDNISLYGSMFGKEKPASNAGRTTEKIRGDATPPAKSEKAIPQFVSAAKAGIYGGTILGFEPVPDAQWKIDQMDAGYGGRAPLMQMVELKRSGDQNQIPPLREYPRCDRPESMLVMNDHTAGYALDDIRLYIAVAAELGYHAVITWWVLKIALEKAGLNVTAMLNESWDRYTDANGGG